MSNEAVKRRIDIVGEAALAALQRARKRAERLALMTGTEPHTNRRWQAGPCNAPAGGGTRGSAQG